MGRGRKFEERKNERFTMISGYEGGRRTPQGKKEYEKSCDVQQSGKNPLRGMNQPGGWGSSAESNTVVRLVLGKWKLF